MSKESTDIGVVRAGSNAGVSRRGAALAVVVFFVVASVINGRALHEKAGKRAYGTARDVWMSATEPLRQISVATRLDQFRALFDKVLDHDS